MKRTGEELLKALRECATAGEFNCSDDPPRDWPELMREAIETIEELMLALEQR